MLWGSLISLSFEDKELIHKLICLKSHRKPEDLNLSLLVFFPSKGLQLKGQTLLLFTLYDFVEVSGAIGMYIIIQFAWNLLA